MQPSLFVAGSESCMNSNDHYGSYSVKNNQRTEITRRIELCNRNSQLLIFRHSICR